MRNELVMWATMALYATANKSVNKNFNNRAANCLLKTNLKCSTVNYF